MRGVVAANVVGLVAAVALSLVAGVRFDRVQGGRDGAEPASEGDGGLVLRGPEGARELRDASGHWIALDDYRRIASGSTIVDELLLRFVEPERIVSFTAFSEQHPETAHRYAGKPRLRALQNLETLLALEPELLILNTLSVSNRVERLREAGIVIFDLGEMRGLESYLANARTVAMLVGRPDLGERHAQQFVRRMRRVAAQVPAEARPQAAYLAVFGTNLYSAGRRTSYDDVMRHAGLVNVVAKEREGWPELSTEEVLELAPNYIVTHRDMTEALCAAPGMYELRACSEPQRFIVELSPTLLSDPGAGMLPAAELLHEAVHGLGE